MAVVDFVKEKAREVVLRLIVLAIGTFYAGVTLASLLLKRIRYGSDIWTVKERSLPPLCLQDTAYGRHAFVRLKVNQTKNKTFIEKIIEKLQI